MLTAIDRSIEYTVFGEDVYDGQKLKYCYLKRVNINVAEVINIVNILVGS